LAGPCRGDLVGIAAAPRRHGDRRCVFVGWLIVIIVVVLVLAVIGLRSVLRGRA